MIGKKEVQLPSTRTLAIVAAVAFVVVNAFIVIPIIRSAFEHPDESFYIQRPDASVFHVDDSYVCRDSLASASLSTTPAQALKAAAAAQQVCKPVTFSLWLQQSFKVRFAEMSLDPRKMYEGTVPEPDNCWQAMDQLSAATALDVNPDALSSAATDLEVIAKTCGPAQVNAFAQVSTWLTNHKT